MKRIHCIFAVAAMLLTACEEKVIDIDPSQSEQRVVVMSAVEADSALAVHLTYSRFFLDDRPFEEITDATVQFTVNGEAVAEPVVRTDGYYTSAYAPRGGDVLGLTVSVPGHGNYNAKTTVPRDPAVTGGSVRAGSDYGEYALKFTIGDAGSEENYYSVRVNYEYDTLFEPIIDDYGNMVYDTVVGPFSGNAYLSCSDYMLVDQSESVGEVVNGEDGGLEVYFTDKNINGRNYVVRLTASLGYSTVSYDEMNSLTSYTSMPRFMLVVASFSRDRYLYDITTSQYSDDGMLGMFEEPVQIHCNIDGGGIGIFAARNLKQFEVTAE